MHKAILFLFILFLSNNLKAQKWWDNHWGFQIGLSAEIGTHVNLIGIKLQTYYTYEFVQFNVGNHLRLNASHFGDRKSYFSQRVNTGIALLAGERNSTPNLILDGLNHQSQHNLALAYNYLWYFDNIGTTQRSGGWGVHIQQLSFYIENDFFAGSGRDRFRTNYIGISYHTDEYNIGVNSHLWTGDTRKTRLLNTPDSLYEKGYKDLRNTAFGKTSHGTVTASFDYHLAFGNMISAEIGIDDERIRHGLQNKLMHNKIFVPKKWRKQNANYPMLNKDGIPIHSKAEAAPPKLFLQFGLNRNLSY